MLRHQLPLNGYANLAAAPGRTGRRMTMKIMVRAAIMVMSIGSSSAYACDGGGTYSATRLIASLHGDQSSLAAAAAGRGVVVQVDGVARSYVSPSRRGAWLFLSAPYSGEQ
jgi:hypothetical protein